MNDEEIIRKLQNVLRGCAMFIRDDRSKSQKEKEEDLEDIRRMYLYISGYKENSRKIKEYDDFISRTEDDGR